MSADVYALGRAAVQRWRADWVAFAHEALGVKLDAEQQAVLRAVQNERYVAVASGTARGKDFVAACAAVCFFYLTPTFEAGQLKANTKVALTAPTGRQVVNIMLPELTRLFNSARARGVVLPGRLSGGGIRTDFAEWFLVGFKADEYNHEAWSGFHAVNTMFVVTEASGISENIFNAIEGNLQGNSRLLLVFNPNTTTGYAARAMQSARFAKFRLNSLHATNVITKRNVFPGQVDYEWVADKVRQWCAPIREEDFDEGRGDFYWEGGYFTPNDLFRVKVEGLFPSEPEGTLIPRAWIDLAVQRWKRRAHCAGALRVGADIAGMGRDATVICYRWGDYVDRLDVRQSSKADHMAIAGELGLILNRPNTMVFIDTIGEGAGVYSRLVEMGKAGAVSCKFSQNARGLHDVTGVHTFHNMRAYCYWALRDWLDPKNGHRAELPPVDALLEELSDVHWQFHSTGGIIIEPKDEIKARLKRSPDYADALANTFYPRDDVREEYLLQDLL